MGIAVPPGYPRIWYESTRSIVSDLAIELILDFLLKGELDRSGQRRHAGVTTDGIGGRGRPDVTGGTGGA